MYVMWKGVACSVRWSHRSRWGSTAVAAEGRRWRWKDGGKQGREKGGGRDKGRSVNWEEGSDMPRGIRRQREEGRQMDREGRSEQMPRRRSREEEGRVVRKGGSEQRARGRQTPREKVGGNLKFHPERAASMVLYKDGEKRELHTCS